MLIGSAVALAAGATITSVQLWPRSSEESISQTPSNALHLVMGGRTLSDLSTAFPPSLRNQLTSIGLQHKQIRFTWVDGDGEIIEGRVDLTPRVNGQQDGAVLKVTARARETVSKKIDEIESTYLNRSATVAGHSLYIGLEKITFEPGVPVVIIANPLDTSDPDDFRRLAFDVPASQVLSNVLRTGDKPELADNPVTFVVTPTSGAQDQLRQPQKKYVQTIWTTLLVQGGNASSVQFVEVAGGPSPSKLAAPTVELPRLPGTPIPPIPDPDKPQQVQCRLSASTYFKPYSAAFVDASKTQADLKDCLSRLSSRSKIRLDGWTAYYGPLTTSGKPASNPPANVTLSQQRVDATANLLIQMGLEKSRIVHAIGHGNADQPDPDPGSSQNRTVHISSE